MPDTVQSAVDEYIRRYSERDVEGVIDARQLGEYSVFPTVHWNVVEANGEVLRDTWTSYHLLDTPNGWRFLSYTNHFQGLACTSASA